MISRCYLPYNLAEDFDGSLQDASTMFQNPLPKKVIVRSGSLFQRFASSSKLKAKALKRG
jgi:hypothetical protein